jgi:hypothetical protein
VVANYAENKDFVGLNRIHENLLISYRDNVEKYARNETMSQIIRHILQAGWEICRRTHNIGRFCRFVAQGA